jgi:hypothetical protein
MLLHQLAASPLLTLHRSGGCNRNYDIPNPTLNVISRPRSDLQEVAGKAKENVFDVVEGCDTSDLLRLANLSA